LRRPKQDKGNSWSFNILSPFACIQCGEHIFETDKAVESAIDLAEATCTHCGHELTESEIISQLRAIPDAAIAQMLENAAELQRPANP
jgi:Zn ribbon nucleic-acid-binding protein